MIYWNFRFRCYQTGKRKKMRNIDLSILKKIPELTETAVFSIQPLAPISMISAILGSYYKTILHPDKQILCGLFENVLGWHISLEDRKMIYKDLERGRKRQKRDFITPQSRSTYKPLLFEYFEVEEIKIESSEGEVLFLMIYGKELIVAVMLSTRT